MAEPTEQTQTNIPSWLKEAMLKLVGDAQRISDQGYQPYARPRLDAQGKPVLDAQGKPILDPIQRVEGFNPLQLQAFNQIAGMQTADQINRATGLAGLAGVDAQRLSRYDPAAAQNFYESPEFQRMATTFQNVNAAPTTNFQMQGPRDVTAQQLQQYQMQGPADVRAPSDYERIQQQALQQYQMQGPQDVYAQQVAAGRMGPVRDVMAGQFNAPQMAGYERIAAPSAYDIERAQAYQYDQLAMSPAERVRAANLREYRMGPAERVGTERFGLGSMLEYMSPYMQGVVERQKQAATRDYMKGLPAISAAAARAGGRGGTREALLQSEAQRNLATQLGDIEAKGLQQAYEQSSGQFERDRAAALQAALANQAATQDVARQNLQAAMGIQQLGAGQSLEAQRLNQAMGLTVGQQNLSAEQARQQFMGSQSLQAQLANQQAAQRSAEFQRQQEMQAAMANQQAGLTVGQQNLAAQLQAMGLNAQQAIEAARLNQAADLTIGQQNLSAEQQANLANQQTGLQAALANQQAGLTTGQQNLAALLGIQQLGAGQNLQAQLANQQMGYNVGQQNLQSLINQSQFGAGQGLQAQQMNQSAQLQAQQQALAQLAQANQFSQQNAQQRAQFGLSGANLAEQSRQFGAGLGMQGLQQQLAAAGMLGNLGQQQYQQQMGINAAQLGAGGQQQALGQELLNLQYQDFINQQQQPYKQLEFMSGILRGLPATGQTQTMYQAPGSLFGQIAGVGLGLGSLFGGFGQTTGK